MKMNPDFTVSVTGAKLKITRLFMESLIAFMKHHRCTSLHRMRYDFIDEWIAKGEYTRLQIIKMQGNYLTRIVSCWMHEQGGGNLRDHWNSATKAIERLTLDEYIELMERSLMLPSELCDDGPVLD